MIEPIIIINGVRLTTAQAMTVRCAIESFAFSLAEANSLGDDEHGLTMTKLYRRRIDEIRRPMYSNNPAYIKE